MRCRFGGHAGSARVAVFFLRHNKAASFLAASSLLCRRKACRQSQATKGVGQSFGNSLTRLEPGNDEAGRRRPALTSPKRAAIIREAPPHRSPVSLPQWPPPYRGPAGFPSLAFAPLESATSERAAARPALTSPKRAAVMREAPAALEPSFPKWPPPHRGPLGLPHCAPGRGASSITLYAVDCVTSLKIFQASLGVVIPAFATLLVQRCPS